MNDDMDHPEHVAAKNDLYFSTIIAEAPMPTALYTGREMIVTFANAPMLKLWGKDSSAIGKPLTAAVPELTGQPFHDLLDAVFNTGVTYTTEEGKTELRINGDLCTFYLNFTYKPLRNEAGQVYGILHMAADVTSQVKAKEELIKAEERIHFALQAAEIGTWELDPVSNLVICDDRCKELYGVAGGNPIRYEDVLEAIHPGDAAAVRRAAAEALNPASDGNYDIKFRTVGHNTQLRWLHAKGRAYFNAAGNAYRFSGIAQDISEEVRSELEQQKLRALVENSAELMSILELNGRNSYLNKAGRELIGFDSHQQVLDTPISDLHAPEHFEQVRKEVLAGIEANGRWSGKMMVRHLKTGEIFPVHNNSIRIDDPHTGQPLAVGAVMRDLRPEVFANAEQNKLLALVETSPDYMAVTALDGSLIYLNKAGKSLMGLAADVDVTSLKASDFYAAEHLEHMKTSVMPVLWKEGRWNGTIYVRHFVTEEIIPCHADFILIEDPVTGEYIGRGATVRDLRPENAAKRELQESAGKLTSILEGLPQIAFTATPEGILDYFSGKWYDYTGYRPDEPIPTEASFFAEEDRAFAIRMWNQDIAAGQPHKIEVRLRRHDGALRWHLSTALPICNEQGEIVSWAGTLTEIHDQKELQRQKDDFLGIASHELKTPVTSIKAYTQILELMLRKSGDDKKADMVRKMDNQLNRLTSLIGDLLDVTKIHTGKLQFNDEDFLFNEVVKEMVEELQRTTEKHKIREIYHGTGTVHADKYRIGQVITNLISNAIKYSPGGNQIVVETSFRGDEVWLCVKDFGIGIASDKTALVFEQFYRVSGNKQHTFPGLGLGLYISSEIIKRAGGKIWVNSKEGEGSSFYFSLPLSEAVTHE